MADNFDKYELQAKDLEKYREMREFFKSAADRTELNEMVMPYLLDSSYERHDINLAMGYVIHGFERVERRLMSMKQTFVKEDGEDNA